MSLFNLIYLCNTYIHTQDSTLHSYRSLIIKTSPTQTKHIITDIQNSLCIWFCTQTKQSNNGYISVYSHRRTNPNLFIFTSTTIDNLIAPRSLSSNIQQQQIIVDADAFDCASIDLVRFGSSTLIYVYVWHI